ncbi:O-methyltransferase [Roseovarius sp. A-2]|uniref:O-methyltransferase n=1 Tax=Roseovarius sp. A-2 TaxID=1570360 RepID=UPI0009B59274|nr:class I SAM-dependent methyltransferase [Roseovarius sp. A-2]GAW37138.1 O-methyltransferase [Roseovarius sp. A-2]
MLKSAGKRLKKTVKTVLPAGLRRDIKVRKARAALDRLPEVSCDPSALRPTSQIDLTAIWQDAAAAEAWAEIAPRLEDHASMAPPAARTDGNRGVNPGDRRAIFHLVRHLQPASVLEIGTNVGFSTLHIAAAMPPESRITTVDIIDVNNPSEQPWADSGLPPYLPRDLLAAAGFAGRVDFVKHNSLDFLDAEVGRAAAYDLIFLDGSHAAEVVYREIPLALRSLAPGGVILLHDYYPDHRWLWDNKVVIPGPCLAVERQRAEGVPVEVLPGGTLPWSTKLGSRVTSLALLARAG